MTIRKNKFIQILSLFLTLTFCMVDLGYGQVVQSQNLVAKVQEDLIDSFKPETEIKSFLDMSIIENSIPDMDIPNGKNSFLNAAKYFNEKVVGEELTWEKVIDLYELIRGDRENSFYKNNPEIRKRRLKTVRNSDFHAHFDFKFHIRNPKGQWINEAHLLKLINNKTLRGKRKKALYYAAYIFTYFSYAQPFYQRSGFDEFHPYKTNSRPAAEEDGHNRLASFLMNYFLRNNNLSPYYFNEKEYPRNYFRETKVEAFLGWQYETTQEEFLDYTIKILHKHIKPAHAFASTPTVKFKEALKIFPKGVFLYPGSGMGITGWPFDTNFVDGSQLKSLPLDKISRVVWLDRYRSPLEWKTHLHQPMLISMDDFKKAFQPALRVPIHEFNDSYEKIFLKETKEYGIYNFTFPKSGKYDWKKREYITSKKRISLPFSLIAGDFMHVDLLSFLPKKLNGVSYIYVKGLFSEQMSADSNPKFYTNLIHQLNIGGLIEIGPSTSNHILDFFSDHYSLIGLRPVLTKKSENKILQKVRQIDRNTLEGLIRLDRAIYHFNLESKLSTHLDFEAWRTLQGLKITQNIFPKEVAQFYINKIRKIIQNQASQSAKIHSWIKSWYDDPNTPIPNLNPKGFKHLLEDQFFDETTGDQISVTMETIREKLTNLFSDQNPKPLLVEQIWEAIRTPPLLKEILGVASLEQLYERFGMKLNKDFSVKQLKSA